MKPGGKLARAMESSTVTPTATRLSSIIAGATTVVLIDIEIPRTGIVAKMRLMSRHEEEGVTLAIAKWLVDSGSMPALSAAGGGMSISGKQAVLSLACAVRDPEDPSLPFGTVDDWSALDDTVIGPVWHRYQDLVEELDPMRAGELTDVDFAEVMAAVKKNDLSLARGFGVPKLFACLRSMADRLATSPTPSL